MLSLIPTPWRIGLLVLAAALIAGSIYATGRSHGADAVQREWDTDKAARMQIALAAEMRAREIERQMTTKLQEAQRAATERETKLAADAAAARAAAGSLRNTVTALRGQLSAATAEACRTTADAALAVFGECQDRYGALAIAADQHASDARLCLDAWPE